MTSSTTLERVARWARSLGPSDIPPDVLRRAALQHLSMAAAVRAADVEPPNDLLERGDRSLRALEAAAARSAAREYDDFGFFGHPGHGAVVAAWAAAEGHRVDEMLAATAIATEVAARLGTWALLQPDAGESRVWLTAAATAVAVGWLRELDAEGLGNALSLALQQPTQLSGQELRSLPSRTRAVQEAVAHGWRAVELASKGDAGDTNVLDYPEGLPNTGSWTPLPVAFEDLGRTWLARALVFRLEPVAPWAQTAVQGFHELLRRHVKAAGKRLRVDQVERVEVRLDHLAWLRARPFPALDGMPDSGSLAFSIPHAIGALVATHESGPGLYAPDLLSERVAEVLSVASKVEVRPDAGLTVARMRGNARALGPVLAGVPRRERLGMARTLLGELLFKAPRPDGSDLTSFLRSDPFAVAEDALSSGEPSLRVGDPERPGGLHIPNPVSLRLYTTRGGWWPERRSVVEGGPEYAIEDLERDVVDKYARCSAFRGTRLDEDRLPAARERAAAFLRAAAEPKGKDGLTAEEAVALLGAS